MTLYLPTTKQCQALLGSGLTGWTAGVLGAGPPLQSRSSVGGAGTPRGMRESRLLLASARHMLSKYPLRAGPCLGHQVQLRMRWAQVPVLGRGLGSPEVCTPGRVWD